MVEDDPLLRRSIARSLDGKYLVRTATDSTEALTRLYEANFDAVITDYDMPGRNGVWLLGTIMKTHPQVRRILLSARVFSGTSAAEVASVAEAHLVKPTGLNDLLDALLRLGVTPAEPHCACETCA